MGRKRVAGRSCPVCGEAVESARAVYCSAGCRKAAQMRRYRARRAGLGEPVTRPVVPVPRPRRWVEGRPQGLQNPHRRPLGYDEMHDALYELSNAADLLGKQYADLIEKAAALLERDPWLADPNFLDRQEWMGYALNVAGTRGEAPLADAFETLTGTRPEPVGYTYRTPEPED